ncbi:MAG: winged helix-turn-helix domain-containing protein [Nanoarchaeota archaeon]
MNNKEIVYREILYNVMEKNNRNLTQSHLAKTLQLSLSTVNNAMQPLRNMGAIKINPRNFIVLDAKKILYYWASVRNLEKDIIYKTRVDMPVKEIEKNMPDDIIYSAYSAYKYKLKDVPADYSEVYVYGTDLEKRFPSNKNAPNLFVLKKDKLAEKYGKTMTIAQLFVDLWNVKEWYATEFIKGLEVKINAILE